MKGVILHGGAGTRLRPLTFSGPKQLIPVANKPVSQYVLEDLISSGIKNVAIVLGETFPELVREYYGDGSKFNCRITYIYQGKPLGIAHAVSLTKDFVDDDKFVVYLGDNLLQYGIKEYIRYFDENDLDAMILLKEVDDPRMFGVVQFDNEGNLIKLVEKPKEPPSKYAVIGVYLFKPIVFDAIKDLKPSWRGEYEITDTIQLLLDRGYKVDYKIIGGWWLDTGKASDILYANSLVLDERIRREIKGKVKDSKIIGRVYIDEDSEVINSTVMGPSIIGRNVKIVNSYVGAYTSIGDYSVIKDSTLEYTIILDHAVIDSVDRLEESLIGRYAKIYRGKSNRKIIKMHVGDHSDIEI